MKIIYPIFALAGIAAAVLWWRGGDQPAQLSIATAVTTNMPSADGDAQQAGNLVQRAIEGLHARQSLSVNLRHRIDLFDNQFIGSGLYQQQGQGTERRFRLELKIQAGDRITSLQQVGDGRYAWNFQESANGPLVSRIDLRRVRNAQLKDANTSSTLQQMHPDSRHSTDAGRGATGNSANPMSELSIGGLPRLLEALRQNFRFTRIEAGHLGETPVWALEGEWQPERLAELLPEQRESIVAGGPADFSKAPHLPQRVVLFLDQAEAFPQRIEYRRQTSAGQGSASEKFTPMVILEFNQVEFDVSIDPRQFVYQPGKQDVLDTTDAYLKSQGLAERR